MKSTNIVPFHSTPCRVKAIAYHRPPPPPEIRNALSFEIPTSELSDFQAYADWVHQQNWSRHRMDPQASLISAAQWDHQREPRPFNKPMGYHMPSMKTMLARIRKVLKSGPVSTLQIEVSQAIFEKLQAKAAHYRISLGETCFLAIGYHAALWRTMVEKSRAKTPFEKFERSLANESRAAR